MKQSRAKIGRKSRSKGYRGEHNLVIRLNEAGVPIKRTAHSGLKGDLTLTTGQRIEVKNRECISDNLWEWQDGVEYVALKKNGKDYLVQMSLDEFIRLFKAIPTTNSISIDELKFLELFRRMQSEKEKSTETNNC